MLRQVLLVLAVSLLLFGGIWGISKIVGGPSYHDWATPINARGRTICHKLSEDVQADGLVCIYMCEDGEKARLDHLKVCLARIEI